MITSIILALWFGLSCGVVTWSIFTDNSYVRHLYDDGTSIWERIFLYAFLFLVWPVAMINVLVDYILKKN